MIKFPRVSNENNLKEMINRVFEAELDVDGDWGYQQENATIIYSSTIPKKQLQHHLAYMRVYLEMNITQEVNSRYAGIDLIELDREKLGEFEKVKYKVTAILEKDYHKFIDEYKNGYEKDDFDLNEHFARRKDATLNREIVHWFDLSRWNGD